MATSFTLNGKPVTIEADPEMPLLWVVRETLGMTGTKFGCGIAACGACTMHVDGVATRTCVLPVADVEGLEVKTIEGVGTAQTPSAVQRAWLTHQVPQCGYCQSGMIMAAEALLDETPDPTNEDIDAAMTNICRCGTYNRVRDAIRTAATLRREG
ncbi:isoquinoline 1-oxidoreductase alpha subunit [Litoreibacter ponti]|uniref:Isoquinoline 1-oxidoreductase alpha subunit n=1 Tax=Litoreibacter ponti TaxID=1510457 RepID=A0A2T6BLD6_9RHOB|nr:(2Fe-2S)-binding protein [Litoreibacter ponti]PTX56862.1 isoquinoline 1-oxidoreductase alpha subunit [Litoreibacter ponti]